MLNYFFHNFQNLFTTSAFSPLFSDGLLARVPDEPGRRYSGLGFTGHVRFLDFSKFKGRLNPVWVTQIRNPVDTFISWWVSNQSSKMGSNLMLFMVGITTFGGKMSISRAKSGSWRVSKGQKSGGTWLWRIVCWTTWESAIWGKMRNLNLQWLWVASLCIKYLISQYFYFKYLF